MRAPALLVVAVLGLVACHKDEDKPAAPPSPVAGKHFRAVWGSGPADVWAVGDKGTIAHFDGKDWSASPSDTDENLTAVLGVGPGSVYATSDKGAIFHWDGKTWTIVSTEPGTTLLHMWASGPADIWTVGVEEEKEAGVMRHWNGTKWETQEIPGASSLWGVGGTGPTDIWMVGTNSSGQGYVIQGDGKHFDANGYKGPPARAVWALAPADVWVAPYEGQLQHWNGKDWAPAQSPEGPWFRMSGSGPDDVWAVGADGLTAHLHAGTWTKVPTGSKAIAFSVWSGGPNLAWTVGHDGMLMRWDGTAWK
jgi:hypothetical protein